MFLVSQNSLYKLCMFNQISTQTFQCLQVKWTMECLAKKYFFSKEQFHQMLDAAGTRSSCLRGLCSELSGIIWDSYLRTLSSSQAALAGAHIALWGCSFQAFLFLLSPFSHLLYPFRITHVYNLYQQDSKNQVISEKKEQKLIQVLLNGFVSDLIRMERTGTDRVKRKRKMLISCHRSHFSSKCNYLD